MNLQDFTAQGRKFRMTKDQRTKVEGGTLTKEDAFQEFVQSGGLNKTRKQNLPDDFWKTEGLTLDNFAETALRITGTKFRFRRTKDQVARNLTREEAFAEIINEKTKN